MKLFQQATLSATFLSIGMYGPGLIISVTLFDNVNTQAQDCHKKYEMSLLQQVYLRKHRAKNGIFR